jgi:hypothetical protein
MRILKNHPVTITLKMATAVFSDIPEILYHLSWLPTAGLKCLQILLGSCENSGSCPSVSEETQCSPVEIYERFEGTYRFHL